MSKPNKQYLQKFRPEWLKDKLFEEWLITKKNENGELIGFCKFCVCSLGSNKYGDLKTHLKTKKHISASRTVTPSRQPSVSSTFVLKPCKSKLAEGKASLFIAEHCSILATDHLGKLVKSMFPDSEIAKDFQMARTKCSEILKNVIAPHFKCSLRDDMGESPYSLLIDESTDVGVLKFLGVVIIYFSVNSGKIVSTFLSLTPIIECNSEAIVQAIKTTLSEFGIPLNNMKGIGTDNASVMVGVNNGVHARLKQDIPNLILVRCVCHSIQLAVSAASVDTIPRCLEFLISETYNWFSRSTQRQAKYALLYQTMNDGQNPLKIVQSCQTRWLSIESAVSRILYQWLELKTHFQIASSAESCYTAQTLFEMYKDEKNYAFLSFLKPVLVQAQSVNKSFESNDVDKTKLLSDITLFIMSIMKKVVIPTVRMDIMKTNVESNLDPKPYLGYEFEKTVEKMLQAEQLDVESEKVLRKRCVSFIVKLISQLRQRLPDNLETLQKIELLSVQYARSALKNQITPLLESMLVPPALIGKIEYQWTAINLIDWKSTTTTEFWIEVSKYRDALDTNPFEELSKFAISMLVLPHSNADVERVFSQMNIVKSKIRNKMKPEMVNSILTIRAGLKRTNHTCHDYELPDSVVSKIGTCEAYARKNTPDTQPASSQGEEQLDSDEEFQI